MMNRITLISKICVAWCFLYFTGYSFQMVSFTMSGDASKLTSTTPLDVKGVSYSYDQKTGCLYDYIRIPGGSEDGGSHTSRDRFVKSTQHTAI